MKKYLDRNGTEIQEDNLVTLYGDYGVVREYEVWPGIRELVFLGPLSFLRIPSQSLLYPLGIIYASIVEGGNKPPLSVSDIRDSGLDGRLKVRVPLSYFKSEELFLVVCPVPERVIDRSEAIVPPQSNRIEVRLKSWWQLFREWVQERLSFILGSKKEEETIVNRYYDSEGKEIKVGDIVLFYGTHDFGVVWELEIWPGIRDMAFLGPLTEDKVRDRKAMSELRISDFMVSVPVRYFSRDQLKIIVIRE